MPEVTMPEATPTVGLMSAIAPIAKRRPVHLIVSAGPNDTLTVVFLPKQTDAKEDPAIARGFTVTEPPDVLDRELGAAMSSAFVPTHMSLQSVLDQAAKATEDARQAALRKSAGAKAGGAKKDPAPGTPQITFDAAPGAAAPAATEPASTAEPPPPAAAPEPADTTPNGGAGDTTEVAAEVPAPAIPAGDAVSTLFD